VASVQASVLLVEQPEGGPIRVSFRSKGAIDVAQFAQQFGGGGHARASGAKINASLDEARELIVRRLAETITAR
jgi:phosphoesterase RecJ-like protein